MSESTLVSFLLFLGPAAVFSVLPFQAFSLGGGPEVVGLLLMADVAATLFAAPLIGTLGDRLGPKRAALIALAFAPVAFLILTAAESLFLLAVSRVLMGIGLAARSSLQGYVVERPAGDRLLSGLAGINGAYGAAFVVGPGLVALLLSYDPAGFEGAAWFAFLCSLAALAAAAALLQRQPRSPAEALVRLSPRKPAVPAEGFSRATVTAVSVQALLAFVFATMAATIGAWSASRLSWGARDLSWGLTVAGGAAVVTQFAAVGMMRWLTDRILAAAAAGVMVIGLALLVAGPSSTSALVALALIGAGSATALLGLQSVVARLGPPDAQGALFGFSLSLNSLGRVLGPIWGGYSLVHVGHAAPYVSGALLALAAAVVMTRFPAHARR